MEQLYRKDGSFLALRTIPTNQAVVTTASENPAELVKSS